MTSSIPSSWRSAAISAWYRPLSPPSSAISPSTATRRRPAARSSRSSRAARIEIGFALYASLTMSPPPGRSRASPRQRLSRIAAAPSAARSSGSPSASYAVRAARTFPARCRCANGSSRRTSVPATANRHASPSRTTAPGSNRRTAMSSRRNGSSEAHRRARRRCRRAAATRSPRHSHGRRPRPCRRARGAPARST